MARDSETATTFAGVELTIIGVFLHPVSFFQDIGFVLFLFGILITTVGILKSLSEQF